MRILIDYAYRKKDVAEIPVEQLSEFVISREGKPSDTEVSISFVTDETIAQLNEEYRGKSGSTDVLSFECDSADDEMPAVLPLEGVPYELGDIVIAPDVAESQCGEYGNSFQGEIELLLVHGLLHLCGYDHIEDDEAEIMEARERELLNAWVLETGEKPIER